MKEKFLLLLLLSSVAGYSQWHLLGPKPISETLSQPYFFSENFGIVNAGTCFFRTTDGFSSYTRVDKVVDGVVRQYDFPDDSTGYIIMSDDPNFGSKLIKTTNGANSFEIIVDTVFRPVSISFINPDTGWLACRMPWPSDLERLSYTTNGGVTWEFISDTLDIYWIKFLDEHTGFYSGYLSLYQTTDGGKSWSELNFPGAFIEKIVFRDSLTWMFLTSSDLRVLLTFDGGLTWEEHLPGYNGGINYIYFEDSTIIIAYGGPTHRGIRSDDLGNEWSHLRFLNHNETVDMVYFKDVYYQFGLGGTLLKSSDRGDSWINLGSRHGGSMQFVDSLNGFTAPWFVTSDGGASWEYKEITIPEYESYSYHFTTPLNGIFSNRSNVYATTDGGAIWDTIMYSDEDEGLIGSVFFNKWEGLLFSDIAVGSNTWDYRVRKSTDGGITWGSYIQFFLYEVGGFVFADLNRWFANHEYDENGYRTTDGGLSWHDNVFAEYQDIYFLDSLTGWATVPGVLIRTTDGGDSFTVINDNFFGGCMNFSNIRNGWMKENKTLFRTTDGGQSWDSVYTTEYPFHTIKIFYDKVFLIGGHGVLYGPGGSPVDLSEHHSFQLKYSLNQNYPNPFNPFTTISYSVLYSSQVSIMIYDILGREIAVLVNEMKQPGGHKVNWNASFLPSGIYFYRLQSGSFTETKKMILMK